MNRLGPASTNKWQIPLNPREPLAQCPRRRHHKHTSPRQTFGSSDVIKYNFVDLLPSKVPFNQAAGRKEGVLRGELQVASAPSLRRSDRAVISPAGPPPVLLWQPVIIHRRDALSCRFQPRCKWTQMGSDRDQANNVLFISSASFFVFSPLTLLSTPPPAHSSSPGFLFLNSCHEVDGLAFYKKVAVLSEVKN